MHDPGGEEWDEIASTEVRRHKAFLQRFGIVPLSASTRAIYKAALADRTIEFLDQAEECSSTQLDQPFT